MMRLILLKLFIFGFLPFYLGQIVHAQSTIPGRVVSLDEAYSLALIRSEQLKIREESIKSADAQYREALSALYPQTYLNAVESLRGGDGGGTGSSSGDGATSFSSRRKDSFRTALNVKQPIFTGFREYLLASSAEKNIKSVTLTKERFKELLYLDVADVYFQIVQLEADISILRKVEKILEERIQELNKWVALGRSRDGEILAVKSDLAASRAIVAQDIGLLNASKEVLSFLIGIPSLDFKVQNPQWSLDIMPLESYLARGAARFDIQAAVERSDSLEDQVTAARRESWPSVFFEGNSYLYEDPSNEREWDIFLRMELPIFDWGAINARIDQQRSALKTSQLQEEELRRIADRDVRVAYAEVESGRDQVAALVESVSASQKNYESQRRDYELGIVTNLDVLAAIRQEQNTKRELSDAEINLQRTIVRLKVAAGGINP